MQGAAGEKKHSKKKTRAGVWFIGRDVAQSKLQIGRMQLATRKHGLRFAGREEKRERESEKPGQEGGRFLGFF
jgi:hypothetical protein